MTDKIRKAQQLTALWRAGRLRAKRSPWDINKLGLLAHYRRRIALVRAGKIHLSHLEGFRANHARLLQDIGPKGKLP